VKRNKLLLILTFCLALYACRAISNQKGVLEPKDIDIFINGCEQLTIVHENYEKSDEWDNYINNYLQWRECMRCIIDDGLYTDDEHIEIFKESLYEHINYILPDEIDKALESMGWRNNRQKNILY
jgi:hypothetical protein